VGVRQLVIRHLLPPWRCISLGFYRIYVYRRSVIFKRCFSYDFRPSVGHRIRSGRREQLQTIPRPRRELLRRTALSLDLTNGVPNISTLVGPSRATNNNSTNRLFSDASRRTIFQADSVNHWTVCFSSTNGSFWFYCENDMPSLPERRPATVQTG
jgi:hypothetical protein